MDANERSIVSVTMISHAMVHTCELSIPILMTLWLDEFAVTEATLGTVVTLGYGLYGFGSLPGGWLTDWMGSRRLMIGCLLGMGVAFGLLAFVPGIWGLGGALLIWGLAASVHHPSSLTLISKGVSRRGTGLGYHGMAGNAGIAMGPLVTTLLLMVMPWRSVAALLALPCIGGGLIALSVPFEEGRDRRPPGTKDPSGDGPGPRSHVSSLSEFFQTSRELFFSPYGLVFLIVVFQGLYYRGFLTFLPELFREMPQLAPISLGHRTLDPGRYVYSGMLTVGILGQYLGGKWSDRVSPGRAWCVILPLQAAIALLFIPATGSVLVFLLLVSGVLGFVLFLIQPVNQTAVAVYTDSEYRGLAYGYTFLGIFGIGSLGAALTGFILTYFSSTVLFVVLCGLGLGSTTVAVVLNRYGSTGPPGEERDS